MQVQEEKLSLEHLAEAINQKETEFSKSSLIHAKTMGEWLLQAKNKVKEIKSNSWGAWLESNCPVISIRTARLYMQIAREWVYLAPSISVILSR